ncbi:MULTISPECIES: CoA-transferase subunit beta [Prauserella salsuginis group]|uniref:Acyl CoA:acetate/3-ketoacid CoA transferase beta subunit n=2 Tax=Prauserella salsuginis group TaxID=2893672 RepID=A0A839XBD3_9PSEU|nr:MULTISPECIES: CoA-transferase [Prauserella salsuginis group]MBB3661282.1 acyl CoA:acetate/3-ketoacid CoA transferase beta subunit [Prauserella sediminis]MCR3719205.1 Acyl CoA:acetate/3-ketoacid CoA transferase, beta subunit [Prauserella flava]MCR3735782.1 Acyl CoA:acetate/3-ketoacid CoA transferase, beta subunit [Prauserella salsuginis]
MNDVTRAEIAVVAVAELFRGDGEIVASPMGTVPSLGAKLARATFEPDLLLSDGQAYLVDGDGTVEGWQPFRRMLDTIVPHGRRHVVMGANQIDRFGNQNISAIGEHGRPAKQLLGVRGAPGNTVNHRTSYWVPRHGTRVFVESVDVVAGVGYDNVAKAGAAAQRFHDVHRVVTNLGVFDFGGPDHAMRAVSLHPGVSEAEVGEATSFPVDCAAAGTTRTPTDGELQLIREVLDPQGVREKEVPS